MINLIEYGNDRFVQSGILRQSFQVLPRNVCLESCFHLYHSAINSDFGVNMGKILRHLAAKDLVSVSVIDVVNVLLVVPQ